LLFFHIWICFKHIFLIQLTNYADRLSIIK
jgi:hypothetical protein